jgi:hypothetical protein
MNLENKAIEQIEKLGKEIEYKLEKKSNTNFKECQTGGKI